MPVGSPQGRSLLEVIDLYTHFYTPMGIARAVDGVSFKLEYGISLGIVGESGSGKSVLSRTIIDILAKNGSVKSKGKIYFEGRDLRSLTDKEMQEVGINPIATDYYEQLDTRLNEAFPHKFEKEGVLFIREKQEGFFLRKSESKLTVSK